MTCTPNTARCADARSYQHVLRPCCRGHVIQITRHVADAFVSIGIPFWADYGTLLGAVRNPLTTWDNYPWLPQSDQPIPPGIVPHDKDADIGVLFVDWDRTCRAVSTLRETHGYDIIERHYRGSIKVRLSQKNHTNLDIFFWHQKPNGLLFRRGYASVDAYKGRHFHRDLLFPLSTVEWEGITLPAPRDPEAFLAMRYGPDWRIPIPANVQRDALVGR
jgi:hypothetical protein